MLAADGTGIKNIAKISVHLVDSFGYETTCSDMNLKLQAPYATCDGNLAERVVLTFHPIQGVKNGETNRFCKLGAFGTPDSGRRGSTLSPLEYLYPLQEGTYSDDTDTTAYFQIVAGCVFGLAVIIISICGAKKCKNGCEQKAPLTEEERREQQRADQIEQRRLQQVRLQELMPQRAQQQPVSAQRRGHRPLTRKESIAMGIPVDDQTLPDPEVAAQDGYGQAVVVVLPPVNENIEEPQPQD